MKCECDDDKYYGSECSRERWSNSIEMWITSKLSHVFNVTQPSTSPPAEDDEGGTPASPEPQPSDSEDDALIAVPTVARRAHGRIVTDGDSD